MTYSIIPGYTLILDSLTWDHERTVFTRIANGDIQMDTTTHRNKGGYRGMGVRTGSDVEHTSIIRKNQSKVLLKFLYREIKTEQELQELKYGSMIQSIEDKSFAQKCGIEYSPDIEWMMVGNDDYFRTSEIADMLPALVVFEAD